MPIDPKIFKAYDIRGLCPEELNEEAAFNIGQAFVKFTGAKKVVVGYDMRPTSPILFEALSRGIRSQGSDVVDIGLVTTPMVYFATADYPEHEAGIMITASHNPREYNGIKMCLGDALPIGGESGMDEMKTLSLAGPYGPALVEGVVTKLDIREAYLRKLFSFVDLTGIKPLKVVADTGNGMEGSIIDDILSRVPGCEYQVLFKELDGTFPNHEANPMKEETLAALRAKVLELGANLGVAFDGDADRFGLMDDKGEIIRGDLVVCLLLPLLLQGQVDQTVLYDIRESLALPEEIEKLGAKAVPTRCGHGLIKPHMRQVDAIFTGELCGHFFFRDFCHAESSDSVMLMIMKLISDTGKPLSELIAPMRRYYHSGEINFKVADKDAILAELEKRYGPEATNAIRIDGIRLEFFDAVNPSSDWWFGVRASNTEPLLRLNMEAKSPAVLEEKKQEIIKIIQQVE